MQLYLLVYRSGGGDFQQYGIDQNWRKHHVWWWNRRRLLWHYCRYDNVIVIVIITVIIIIFGSCVLTELPLTWKVRESQGKLGNWRGQDWKEFGNFVSNQGKIACIIRLWSCCCNIVSGHECDELLSIISIWFLYYLCCYF